MSGADPTFDLPALLGDLEAEAREAGEALFVAARNELPEIEARLGAQARADFVETLRDLARLTVREVKGENVYAEMAFCRGTLKRFAAVGAVIVDRAARDLQKNFLRIGGQFAEKAGMILARFARGLMLGALA